MKLVSFSSAIGSRRYSMLLTLCVLAALPGIALAHAHPEQRTPAANATLQQAPKQVKILFTEDLEAAFSTLKVTNAQGQSVNQGHSHVDDNNPRVMVASLKSLQPGTYTVHWHAVARDGHTTHGEYSFQLK